MSSLRSQGVGHVICYFKELEPSSVGFALQCHTEFLPKSIYCLWV